MKKYLIAGALVVAFAAPAFAADYYVALEVWRRSSRLRSHDDRAGCEDAQDDGQVQI